MLLLFHFMIKEVEPHLSNPGLECVTVILQLFFLGFKNLIQLGKVGVGRVAQERCAHTNKYVPDKSRLLKMCLMTSLLDISWACKSI